MILTEDSTDFEKAYITRTCGDDPRTEYGHNRKSSYYPHMRGWSWALSVCLCFQTILPAHAGMILIEYRADKQGENITRTCGDDPVTCAPCVCLDRYYPHMRGWSCNEYVFTEPTLILPAHAGMILYVSRWCLTRMHITRTCGDDPNDICHFWRKREYYPHMRGWS